MNELKELLQQIGLPPTLVLIVVIIAMIGVFFAKTALQRKHEREKKKYDKLLEYQGLQEAALLKAYRKLYEEVDLKSLTPSEFRNLVSEADQLIMEPFTNYRAYMDRRIADSLFNLHNVIAQYKGDPTMPYTITPEAISNLCFYRERFLMDIEAFKTLINDLV
jgi:hypothetical protein